MSISSIAFALNPYPHAVFKASEKRCEQVFGVENGDTHGFLPFVSIQGLRSSGAIA
jgi:hypothetical protein